MLSEMWQVSMPTHLLSQIQEEIQALETLDEVSNEEVLELGSIMASTYVPKSFSQAQKKASRINVVSQ